MRRFASTYSVILTALILSFTLPALAKAPVVPCVIKAEYPHSTGTSTQGLFFHDDLLLESSGGYGKSFLAVVELETGRQLRTTKTESILFAEGIAPQGDTLRLLTWKSGRGFIHDIKTLEFKQEFPYRKDSENTEGWGLTSDGTRFILSSGSATLRFHALDDFALLGTLTVTDDGTPVRMLNELEWVDGLVYANIWKADEIVVIDPVTGHLLGRIDLTPLRKRIGWQCGVANGIAYDVRSGRLFVTGKRWDLLFEIEMPKF